MHVIETETLIVSDAGHQVRHFHQVFVSETSIYQQVITQAMIVDLVEEAELDLGRLPKLIVINQSATAAIFMQDATETTTQETVVAPHHKLHTT